MAVSLEQEAAAPEGLGHAVPVPTCSAPSLPLAFARFPATGLGLQLWSGPGSGFAPGHGLWVSLTFVLCSSCPAFQSEPEPFPASKLGAFLLFTTFQTYTVSSRKLSS